MTRSMSTEFPRASVMAEEGVSGEMATAARIPVEWMSSTSSCAFSVVVWSGEWSKRGERRVSGDQVEGDGEEGLRQHLRGSAKASMWNV